MNIKFYLALFTFAYTTVCLQAQKENPRGLFRLQKFCYDDKTERVPSFEQYKYCCDNITLTAMILKRTARKTTYFQIQTSDPAFMFTGKKPQGVDGHGQQIFDSNQKKFTLRWYNTRFSSPYFPKNTFINELYSSTEKVDPELKLTFELLKQNTGKVQNPFIGTWRRTGLTLDSGEDAPIFPADQLTGAHSTTMYKVYGDDRVVTLNIMSAPTGAFALPGNIGTCKYTANNQLEEHENTLSIFWRGKDRFVLGFVQNGDSCYEVWDRCGLPKNVQLAMGTNVPQSVIPLLQYARTDSIYQQPDKLPEFRGGTGQMLAYINKKMKYPEIAIENGIEARLFIRFVIEKNGMVNQVEVFKTDVTLASDAKEPKPEVKEQAVAAMQEEAIHVLKSTPQWTPGLINGGEYVRCQMNVPVTFKLEPSTQKKQ